MLDRYWWRVYAIASAFPLLVVVVGSAVNEWTLVAATASSYVASTCLWAAATLVLWRLQVNADD